VARLTATAVVLAALAAASAAYAAPAPLGHRTSDPALGKLDSHLQTLVAASRARRSPTPAQRDGLTLRGGDVLVDVYVDGGMSAARRALEALGMRVQAVSNRRPERMVEGWLTADEAAQAAVLGSVRAVLPVVGYGTDVGSVTSQGDAAHNGPAARALGFNGAGVTTGVISDSINQVAGGIATSVGTTDLPADTVALLDAAGGSDEGRAMSEIIYDEAPGITKLRFSTGGLGAASKATSINNLVSAGARVIADDTFYLTEPMFQDGVIAQAVDAAKAAGVAYFSSAGNRARQSWEGTYTPGTGDFNNFNPGGTEDQIQSIVSLQPGQSIQVVLQWGEPLGRVTTDLDIFLVDVSAANAQVGTAGTTDNFATQIPLETATWTNPNGTAHTVGLVIQRFDGTGTPRIKYIARNNPTAPFSVAEHSSNSGTINPDAASSNGAFTVAAVDFSDAGLNTAEAFSSRGPTAPHLFDAAGNPLASPDVRAKPDAAAADGVSTSVPGFNPFFGTSAATPSAAGIGVLLRSANPTMSVNEVYAILRNVANAIDCTSATGVPDFDCGAGFVLADKAVTQALDHTPPSVTPSVVSGASQANGFFHGDVTVSFAVADAESPVGDATGCATTVINTDGSFPFTCTAGSAGGTTTQSLTVKRDASPPTGLTITGIAAKTYTPANLPKLSSIHCNASDPTSGIASCALSGFSRSRGSHKLTATATDGAALTSTKSLTYKVAPIAGISVARTIKLGKLISSGLPVQLNVDKGTKLSIKVTATSATPAAARSVVVGTFKKTIKKGGKVKVRVRLNRVGRALLSNSKRATLRVKITGSSKGAGKATVTKTVKAKR
jgi:hypothetical protein